MAKVYYLITYSTAYHSMSANMDKDSVCTTTNFWIYGNPEEQPQNKTALQ